MVPHIGELLVRRGVATAAQVESALHDPRDRPLPLASRLLEAGVDEGALAAALAERFGMPGVDLSRTTIDLDALEAVPRTVAEQDLILPLSLEGGRIHLAMARPLDDRVVAELRFVTGREVSVYAAIRSALDRAIEGAYEARARGERSWRGANAGPLPELGAAFPEGEAADEPLDVVEVLEADLLPDEPDVGVRIEVGAPEPLPVRADARPLALVVDDEPEIRQLVQRTLESRGWAVELATDGEEALARADALLPDVVLLDAMLPRLHGFEACRRLRSSPRTRNVPVVMMTAIYRGWRFAEDARENYGAVDYVEKPFRLDDLARRVAAAREASASRPLAPAPEADARVARGRALLDEGRAVEAAALLADAAHADPLGAEAHLQLGRALAATGDAFGAMTALERAVELRPGNLPGLRALARLYEEKGFRRNAAGTLERAVAAAPEGAERAAIREDLLRLLA
ncbi:response regulator receiver protein [Anaeromyxobacter dehalogenans 2CP-1]|uniref:Response regulator receiver protein n=1 Tax=Anaeromyxobacter dehalogenans (strain ATCC BAA-258 / DSM 21875 / 2CP-1) TaxID=455488 RepID=B8JEE7_ANAD2|nr:response regulator [Anaeromyxobacter dehalogenans]ACL64273.1 response regulator receiver protein [Anaeromyxobacter dehalogenans 2CP-1]